MTKRRVIKLIAFLIIAFYIFQLIPGFLTEVEGFDGHALNTDNILPFGMANNSVFAINRENVKPLFQKIPAKYSYSILNQIPILIISSNDNFGQKEPFDYRKSIRQSVPHYFHGSKYRNRGFVV